ncbi:MAG TPA: hypothetical protein VFD90_10100 [Gaiellales bacterium]|jgi:hypothetical protein|nr:hypothetical protein [Gaiellales bacterium]
MTPGLAVYLAIWLAIGAVNALKGKWWMAVLFSAGLIGIITAIRVAKPGSHWDRNWSSVAAHEKAVGRFTKHRDVATALPPMP